MTPIRHLERPGPIRGPPRAQKRTGQALTSALLAARLINSDALALLPVKRAKYFAARPDMGRGAGSEEKREAGSEEKRTLVLGVGGLSRGRHEVC